MTDEIQEKVERDSPRKVREDLEPRIAKLECGGSDSGRIEELEAKLNHLTGAIIESAHVMGWPKDLLMAHGLKPFDKDTDKLSIKR